MIKIFKDNDTKVVTQGVYNSLYKPLGYKPVEATKPVAPIQPKVEETVVEEPKVEEPKVEELKVEEPKVEKVVKKESSGNKKKRGE